MMYTSPYIFCGSSSRFRFSSSPKFPSLPPLIKHVSAFSSSPSDILPSSPLSSTTPTVAFSQKTFILKNISLPGLVMETDKQRRPQQQQQYEQQSTQNRRRMGFWTKDDSNKVKEFFDDFVMRMNLDPNDPNTWYYFVTHSDIIRAGVSFIVCFR